MDWNSAIAELVEARDVARKADERLAAAKKVFKDDANGGEYQWEATDGTIVSSTKKQRTGWDSNALIKKLGNDVNKFKKSSSFIEISIKLPD